jgi:hypothetical protein
MRVITVDSKKLSPKKYYAVEYNGIIGMITRREFEKDIYRVMCFDEITDGNEWDFYRHKYLSTVVKNLIEHGFEVFEFPSYGEMFRFLARNT